MPAPTGLSDSDKAALGGRPLSGQDWGKILYPAAQSTADIGSHSQASIITHGRELAATILQDGTKAAQLGVSVYSGIQAANAGSGAGAAPDYESAPGDSEYNGIPGYNVPSLPAYADGTPAVSDDTWALVGERGPELAYLSKGTTVVPNDRTQGMLSGGHGGAPNLTINTSGSVTREKMRMTVNQALTAYHQHVAGKTAVSAVQNRKSRLPSRRR